MALANFYWATGRVEPAEQGFGKALELEPASEEANRAMALLYLTTGRVARAEPFLKRVAEASKRPRALFSLTDYYVNIGRASEAVALLEAALRADPSSHAIQLKLARTLDAAGDRQKAHALVDALIKADPRGGPSHLLKGQLELEDGRRNEALASVKAAVSAQPSSPEAQFALGKLYAARGDASAAEGAFQEVLRLNPRAAAAQVEISLLRLQSGNTQGSLQAAQEAVASLPQNVEVRLALIRGLLVSRDLARAETEVSALLKAYPDVPSVHVQQGALEAGRNNPAAARAAFDRAIRLNPKSLEALAGLVALDLGAKDFVAAKARVEQRLGDGEPSSALLLLAARTYGAARDLASAEKTLRRIVESDPTLLPAYAMLGQLYMSQRRLDEALQNFDALAEKHSRPVGALTMAGIILQAQGRLPEARRRFERALGVDPRAAVAANNLAWLYAEAGEHLDQAVRLAEVAAQALPEMPEVLNTLGWVYYKSELPALAVPPLVRAVERDQKNPIYHFQLGLAYAKAGDAVHSRRSLTTALSLKPDFPGAEEARRALAKLDERPTQ
jgi:tetratricopeptide (TPR) repeat protein